MEPQGARSNSPAPAAATPQHIGPQSVLPPDYSFAQMPAGDNSSYATFLAYALLSTADAAHAPRYLSISAVCRAVAAAAATDPPPENIWRGDTASAWGRYDNLEDQLTSIQDRLLLSHAIHR